METKITALLALTLTTVATACGPQTTGERAKDKAEDAAHETGQAVERTGEKVKDAAN